MRYIFLAVSLFFLLFYSKAQANSQKANRPIYNIGDTWEYSKVIDKFTRSGETMKVINSDKNTITTSLEVEFFDEINSKKNSKYEVIRNLDFNVIETADTTYSNEFINYDWPLRVGKSWKFQSKLTDKKSNRITTIECECKVISSEKISILNRDFDAFVIEDKCDRKTSDNIFSYSIKRWYAPDVKNTVYSEGYNRKSSKGVTISRLVDFSLK